ncbi:MAG: response regulator [Candidatus Nitricoxidivorans perseverans]|uniref:Response regulator n=1 Tax=Candidatus Nitricoxidivorans perseverans TaxID=2975601 RepID=A0AA49FLC6_9PROT|nr:MAG: response regulator [Candidatus Nitricoxidivorans perseverans]
MSERTLLLVDDEESILSSLNRLLRRDGYRILRAGSGQEGLELLAANPVGVIISDQRMPVMTGTEFFSRVKDLYPETVRIILSGYTELDSITDAINRGAIYKFLSKPWDDDLLRANVDEAFRHHEMKQENQRLTGELQAANEALSALNRDLERRVEEKTREMVRNLNILRVSQEILDHLPVAVVGVDEDGMIAVTNQRANELFARPENGPLLGETAEGRIPAPLLECMKGCADLAGCDRQPSRKTGCLDDGAACDYWCYPMGVTSPARGCVLVVDPKQAGNAGS